MRTYGELGSVGLRIFTGIVGGESGFGAREMRREWVISIRLRREKIVRLRTTACLSSLRTGTPRDNVCAAWVAGSVRTLTAHLPGKQHEGSSLWL